eukprot:3446291-Ditylum_brightwellii.AAC.1
MCIAVAVVVHSRSCSGGAWLFLRWWCMAALRWGACSLGGWRSSPLVVSLWRKGSPPEHDSLLSFKFTLLE